MKKFIITITAVVSAAMIFTGCSKDDKKSVGTKEDLIGTWTETRYEETFRGSCVYVEEDVEYTEYTYEFRSDNTMTFYINGIRESSYTYLFNQSDKTLRLSHQYSSYSEFYDFSVEELTSKKLVWIAYPDEYTKSRANETKFGTYKGTTIYVNSSDIGSTSLNGWYYEESNTPIWVELEYNEGDKTDINSFYVIDSYREYLTKTK